MRSWRTIAHTVHTVANRSTPALPDRRCCRPPTAVKIHTSFIGVKSKHLTTTPHGWSMEKKAIFILSWVTEILSTILSIKVKDRHASHSQHILNTKVNYNITVLLCRTVLHCTKAEGIVCCPCKNLTICQ